MKNFLALIMFMSLPVYADVAVIVHPDNIQPFDKYSINRLFLGKDKTFANKTSVLLVAQSQNTIASQEFNSKVLEKNAKQLNAHWSRLVFTGKGTPPDELDSDVEVITRVKENNNAIGYINSESITAEVKVVAVF